MDLASHIQKLIEPTVGDLGFEIVRVRISGKKKLSMQVMVEHKDGQGMTVDDATRFFMDNAYMGEHPARREAMRGTFDPGYLSYTLGKLMILKLREDFQREQGATYSLKGFHDRLLSYGAPPVSLLRQVMLTEPGESAI